MCRHLLRALICAQAAPSAEHLRIGAVPCHTCLLTVFSARKVDGSGFIFDNERLQKNHSQA